VIEPGAPAPDFELPDQDGEPVVLSGLRGGMVVVYFYPRPTPRGKTAASRSERWDVWFHADAPLSRVGASYACEIRPLRYSINVTLDGCCDHRAIPADEDLHRHAAENLNQADALLFGRVTYEMMESALRPPAPTGARPDWMEPFAQTINAAKKWLSGGDRR